MKRLPAALCMIVLSVISLNLISCFDAAENEYRVTVPTYATVTRNEAGKVRLYLDENRGILVPHADGKDIDWGDAARVRITYDLPVVNGNTTSMENLNFSTPVRSAVKIDTVSMVDVTGNDALLASLAGDTLGVFMVQAYRGYLTVQVYNATYKDFDMTFSYDRTLFDGKNLYLHMHYTENSEVWNKDFLPSASAALPEFLSGNGVVTEDTLNIHVIAPVWYDQKRDSAYADTATCRISRGRLTQPVY